MPTAVGLGNLPGELLQVVFRHIGLGGGTTQDLLNFALSSKRVYDHVWPKANAWDALMEIADYEHSIDVPGEGSFGVNVSPDGSVLACMSSVPDQLFGGVIHRFHVPSKTLDSLQVLEQVRVGKNHVEISADGMTIAACNDFATSLLVWNFGECVIPLEIPQRCASICLPDSRNDIVVCGFSLRSEGVRIYDLSLGILKSALTRPARSWSEGWTSEYTDICLVEVTPDGKSVLEMRNQGSGSDDTTDFALWDIETRTLKWTWYARGTRIWKPSFHFTGEFFCTVCYPDIDHNTTDSVLELWRLGDQFTHPVESWKFCTPRARPLVRRHEDPNRLDVRIPQAVTKRCDHPIQVGRMIVSLDPNSSGEIVVRKRLLAGGPAEYVNPGDSRVVVINSKCCMATKHEVALFSMFWPNPDGETAIRLYLKNLRYTTIAR